MRKEIVLCSFLISIFLTAVIPSGILIADDEQPYARRHQLGARFGLWSNQGDTPPKYFVDESEGIIIQSDISKSNVYIEGYGGYNLFPGGMLEVSLGMVSRGDVMVEHNGMSYFGGLVLYPMLVSFKYYLPIPGADKFYPYFQVGGGIHYGRHSIQFTNDYYFPSNTASGTDINYMLGIGADWRVAGDFAMEVNARHMPVEFGDGLFRVKDYGATTITLGFKYLLKSKKKK